MIVDLPTVSADVSWTVSPISTREDGKTVYEEVAVTNKEVWFYSLTTSTETSGYPLTMTGELLVFLLHTMPYLECSATLVEDANGLEETFTYGPSFDPGRLFYQSCSFEGTTKGSCVLSNVFGPGSVKLTDVATVTGVPTPIYTLVTSGARPCWTKRISIITLSSMMGYALVVWMVLGL